MKKSKPQIKYVTVEEWFTKKYGVVHMHWKFQDGQEMVRRTPYKDIPVFELKSNWFEEVNQ